MSLAFSTQERDKHKREDLKLELLERVEQEQKVVMDALKAFHRCDSQDADKYCELAQATIAAIDHVLGQGDWEDSLFLRNTAKPMKQLRQKIADILADFNVEAGEVNYVVPELSEDMIAAYILVYQSNGHDLAKWAALLKSLERYALGRPVYANEADVQKVIRMKMSQECQDAYVKVAVKRSALQDDTMFSQRVDRFGNKLLTLPAGAVNCNQILEFVHAGKRYYYIKGELINVSSTTKCH